MSATAYNRRITDRPAVTDPRVAEFTACMAYLCRNTTLTAAQAVVACYAQQSTGQFVRTQA